MHPNIPPPGPAPVRGLAPDQHISKETLQQWQTVGDTAPDITDPPIEPLIFRTLLMSETSKLTGLFRVCSAAYLSFYHEEAMKAQRRARLGVVGHAPTTLRWEIPLSAFPNSTTSKLASLFSSLQTVSLMLSVKQGNCQYQF